MRIDSIDPMSRLSTAILLWRRARHYFGGPRGWLALDALALVLGIVLNWPWLVAAGLAPLLLSALPCAVMCGLGLCASKMANDSCQTPGSADSLKASVP